jgi:MoxR-like ATPase
MAKAKVKERSADNGSEAPRKKVSVQDKICDAARVLNSVLIEREEEVKLCLTAMVAQEHVLLVGPPGTAKSLLLDAVSKWVDGEKYTYLLTRFTDPAEVMGPPNLKSLKEGRWERVTQGMLVEAHLAYLDEIFKASSAILNTLLNVLNEREVRNGATKISCPLRLCVAASNEWPQGEDLGALFDRFLFRKKVKPLGVDGRRKLLKRMVENDSFSCKFREKITPEEIDQAREEAKVIPWKDGAKKALWMCLEEISKEGIEVSDRRIGKCIGACRSYCYVMGDDEVSEEHLEVLAHVLWSSPEGHPEKVQKVIAKISNPVGAAVDEQLAIMEEVVSKCHPVEAANKLKEIARAVANLDRHPSRERALAIIQEQQREIYHKVVGVAHKE